jgi:hypothetical protein
MKIPTPPSVTVSDNGEVEIDQEKLVKYKNDIMLFKAEFESAINGCDPNDLDAIATALVNMLAK